MNFFHFCGLYIENRCLSKNNPPVLPATVENGSFCFSSMRLSMIVKPHTHLRTKAGTPPASSEVLFSWIDLVLSSSAPGWRLLRPTGPGVPARVPPQPLCWWAAEQRCWTPTLEARWLRETDALSARRFCSSAVALQCASLSSRGQWYSSVPSGCTGRLAHFITERSWGILVLVVTWRFAHKGRRHFQLVFTTAPMITLVWLLVWNFPNIFYYHHYGKDNACYDYYKSIKLVSLFWHRERKNFYYLMTHFNLHVLNQSLSSPRIDWKYKTKTFTCCFPLVFAFSYWSL